MNATLDATNDVVNDIAQLYTLFQRPIVAYLTRLVGERETAEDLYQDTFIKVIMHWATQKNPDRRSSWLYRIATNTAYDHLRHVKRKSFFPLDMVEEVVDEHSAPDEQMALSAPINDALEQVPPYYRIPLLLYIRDGYSTEEIATSLGCSHLAVRLRVSRGRTRFKRAYAD